MIAKSLATIGLLTLLAAPAFGQTSTPRIDQREANQSNRITNGVNSGQLNARETNRLNARETRLSNAEARAKADGTVTGVERRHLKRMENRDSRAIYRQKHDAQ